MEMKEIELLAHHAHHAGKRRSNRIGFRSTSLGVEVAYPFNRYVWLATGASYVNGTVIHVNGGMYGG